MSYYIRCIVSQYCSAIAIFKSRSISLRKTLLYRIEKKKVHTSTPILAYYNITISTIYQNEGNAYYRVQVSLSMLFCIFYLVICWKFCSRKVWDVSGWFQYNTKWSLLYSMVYVHSKQLHKNFKSLKIFFIIIF